MRGRKILSGFSAVALLVGASCSLNPQPEPPVGGGLGNGIGPSGSPASMSSDAATTVPGVNLNAEGGARDNAEAGAERQDSSSTSDGSSVDGGSFDAGVEANDAAAEAGDAGGESSPDAGSDAPEEGATTAD